LARTVRVAAAQTHDFREDVDAALLCLTDFTTRAESVGVSLLCFPEGFLQGYLTEEAAARRNAFDLASSAFQAILAQFPRTGPMIVLGLIEKDGERLFNTAVVIKDGALVGRYRKAHLLRRERIFKAGLDAAIFEVDGLRFGINICYDTNFPEAARKVANLGASLIVCAANNMLPRQAAQTWKDAHNSVRDERCRETGLWLISADVTGERDDCISFGPTAILNPAGEVVAQLPLNSRGLLVFDLPCP